MKTVYKRAPGTIRDPINLPGDITTACIKYNLKNFFNRKKSCDSVRIVDKLFSNKFKSCLAP